MIARVLLWGRTIGAVSLEAGRDHAAFQYAPAFARSGIEVSPLTMPFSDRVYVFPELPLRTFHGLPGMLADALPDRFGNLLIDAWLATQGRTPDGFSAVERLCYTGTRGMGALEFAPVLGPRPRKAARIEIEALVRLASEVLSQRAGLLGSFQGPARQRALQAILRVGTSAGGARAKAVIAWNRKTDEIKAGQLDAPPGYEYFLLKFDGMGEDSELGASKDYGRVEFAYYLMARKAGIDMSECRLLHENGRAHFMTKRFDREEGGVRHHMQTLCAIDHVDFKKKGTNSYAQLFQVISQLALPYEQKEEAFRRMVFNVMARNCDDHTKNLSFRLRQGSPWELAPAYDITFAHNPKGEWTNQHLMSVNGKFKGFTEDDMLRVADRFGIGTAKKVIADVQEAIAQWPDFAKQASLSQAATQEIGKQHILLAKQTKGVK